MTGHTCAAAARAAAAHLVLVLLLACASAHEPPPLLPGPAPPPCTIAREPALTVAAFRARFKGRAPVVFSAAASASSAAAASDAAAQLRARLSRAALLASHGGAAVTLASSNSFSHAKRAATLREYVERHVDAGVDAARSAEETWYLFGDTERSAHWDSLTRGYAPPLDAAGDEGLVVLGVGGRGSGVKGLRPAELADICDAARYSPAFFESLGRVDLLVSAIPCKDFSTAGKGAGVAAPRTGSFFEGIGVSLGRPPCPPQRR